MTELHLPFGAALGDRALFATCTTAVYLVFFWGHLLALHVAAAAGVLDKYKLQPARDPDPALLRKAYVQAALSHGATLPVGVYFVYSYVCTSVRLREVPSLWQGLWTLVVWHILFDTWFYWAHRALHTPLLYRAVHK
eukprot:gene4715-4896_t